MYILSHTNLWAGVEIAEEMGFQPQLGDQKPGSDDVRTLGVGEPAVPKGEDIG